VVSGAVVPGTVVSGTVVSGALVVSGAVEGSVCSVVGTVVLGWVVSGTCLQADSTIIRTSSSAKNRFIDLMAVLLYVS
jgi:hypothetical protein